MVKPALAASRAVRVLDFLALHPGRPFSLKELSQAVAVSPASLIAVLAALTDGGYVSRHPNHKTYTVGPAVVALGHAAMVQHPMIEAARLELELLAEEIEGQCAATVLMGGELVSVAVVGRPRRAATWTQVGTRVPFVAPVGVPFAAYGSDELRDRWMQRSRRSVDDHRLRQLTRALDAVRERGYSVNRERRAREELGRALRALADEPSSPDARRRVDELLEDLSEGFIVTEIEATDIVDVSNMTAPVFSPVGEVVMVLTAGGFARPLTGEEITDAGRLLLASADLISAKAFGVGTPRSTRPMRRAVNDVD
jgi:DNA-binding IclR family transcriptional regulator